MTSSSLSASSSLDSDSVATSSRLNSSKLNSSRGPGVPRLNISSSMRSTFHTRAASADLQQAAEQEDEMREAGRSFFGDIERQALGHGKMQAVRFSEPVAPDKPYSSLSEKLELRTFVTALDYERSKRLLYKDNDIHVLAVQLVFLLIVDRNGDLDPAYCDKYPWDKKMQNIPFILHHHFNSPVIINLLPRIINALGALGSASMLFLRVLCSHLFRPDWYTNRARISGVAGAYATVYRCSVPWWSKDKGFVLKVIDAPKHNNDRCSQVEFYSEMFIHQSLENHPKACQMVDFGVDLSSDAMILVLKEYKCSLRQWRSRQNSEISANIGIYWMIFREILVASFELLKKGIVHFDLKCDNILLDPVPGCSQESFWRGIVSSRARKLISRKSNSINSQKLAFDVVLGDFGESVLFQGGMNGAQDGITTQARGTDAFKSPEMLLVGGFTQVNKRTFDRRRHQQGAGAASDVWSLGCLLFELMTGKPLFNDSDWLQLVARVTSPGVDLINGMFLASVLSTRL